VTLLDYEFRTPYYLENFRTVLNTVLEDEHNVNLYNSDDMDVISTFNELSGELKYIICYSAIRQGI
jgi:hypothetical protein